MTQRNSEATMPQNERRRSWNTLLPLHLLIKSGCLAILLLSALACSQRMDEQPKYNPLEESDFFDDGQSARLLVPNTVARGHVTVDKPLYTGESDGELATRFPFEITRKVLERGQERFNIFCSPCHGRTGYGNGIVAQKGFKVPPASFHSERLREAPVGHFFNVITSGIGAMYGYAYRIPPKDRWAIIAYVRALQLSQNATLADVPQGQREKLSGMKK